MWNHSGNGTGGGVSKFFAEPTYQNNLSSPLQTLLHGMRGSPDVAGDADPNTGYVLYSASEGGNLVVGGTSGVAPLWTALIAMFNQSLGTNVGFFQPFLYSHTNICRDITQGNNGAFSAGVGWDACTGWGSPNGVQILNALSSGVAPVANFTGTPLSGIIPLTVNFTDTSTNSPTSWLWNFGNGATSTSQSPSHVYTSAGQYTVALTATNLSGSNTKTQTNYITATAPITPVVSFSGTPLSGA